MASPEYQRTQRLMRHEAAAGISPLNYAVARAVPTVVLPEGAVNIYAHERGIEVQEVVYRADFEVMDYAFTRLGDRLIRLGRAAGGIVFRSTPQVTTDGLSSQVIVWALCWFHPRHVIEELRAEVSPGNQSLWTGGHPSRYPGLNKPTPVQVWYA